jgi:hypothetical protein
MASELSANFGKGMESSQVHEDGCDALAAVLGARVELVMEEVMVRLILLAILVVQDLQPLPIHLRQVCDHADAPLYRLNHFILLHGHP